MGYHFAEDMTLPQSDQLLSLRTSLPRSQLNTALSKFEPTMLGWCDQKVNKTDRSGVILKCRLN